MPHLILGSLIAQLAGDGGAECPAGPQERAKMFEELLGRAAARGERVIVVVDGLDELPADAGDPPPFLPTDALPAGVFVVVGERLDRLRDAIAGLPVGEIDLPPLGLDEVAEVLRARRPGLTDAEVERVAAASQGNPLYLHAVADELARDPAFDLSGLPAGIDGFFARATAPLRKDGNAPGRDVLGLLSVARKPLSARDLAQATGSRQRDIHDRGLAPVRQFLFEADDGYSFYHARFRDFVLRKVLYEDELPEYHRQLAAWLGRPEARTADYRLDAFVTFRNDAIGHGAERPDHVCRRDLAGWLPFVGDLLRAAAALAGRPLLLVTATDRAQVWTGPEPAAATVPGSFTRGLVGRFVLGPAAQPLPLDPFVCYAPDPDQTRRLHYYDSLAAYRATRKRATVLEYDGGMRHDREEPVPGLEAAFTTGVLEKAFGRHRGRTAVIEGRVANFGSLVEAEADIVGRRFVIDAVKRFVADNDRGLLVIEGEPGRGKTALMAHLLEDGYGSHAPRPARFFYRRTAGITDPDVCVASVYHELLATHGIAEAAESAARQTPDEVYTKRSTCWRPRSPRGSCRTARN